MDSATEEGVRVEENLRYLNGVGIQFQHNFGGGDLAGMAAQAAFDVLMTNWVSAAGDDYPFKTGTTMGAIVCQDLKDVADRLNEMAFWKKTSPDNTGGQGS